MLIASDLGFDAQARRTFEKFAEEDFQLPADSKFLVTLSYLAEVAAKLGGEKQIGSIYQKLAPFADQSIIAPTFTLCCGSAARYLGALTDALGDFAKSEVHFEQALTMNQAMSARPWLAHTQFECARMLTRRGRKGDLTRAMDLTKEALATASELGMQALLAKIGGASEIKRVN